MKRTMYVLLIVGAALTLGCEKKEAKINLPQEVEVVVSPQPPSQLAKNDQPSAVPNSAPMLGSAMLTGSVETYRNSMIASNVSGVVDEVFVEEGEMVKMGDKLVDIDPATFRLRLRQAEAGRMRAQAQVDMLQSQTNRAKRLLDRKALPVADFEAIAGQLDVAKAAVAEAKVGVALTRKMLADSKIRAPYGAVVTKVSTAQGNFASAGPSALVEIAEISRLRARIQVPEEYSNRVNTDQILSLYVPATGQNLKGTIERINPTVTRGTRSFAILIKLDNSDMKLRPGMFVQTSLEAIAGGK